MPSDELANGSSWPVADGPARLNGSGAKAVIGPDGTLLTLADLPDPKTDRWVSRRKAEVVAAVRGGLLSLDEACSRYSLSLQELLGWQRSIDRYGLAGLRATRIKQYRQPEAVRPLGAREEATVLKAGGSV
jgi:hypothetical protein